MRYIGVKNYTESLDCTVFKHKMKVYRLKYGWRQTQWTNSFFAMRLSEDLQITM